MAKPMAEQTIMETLQRGDKFTVTTVKRMDMRELKPGHPFGQLEKTSRYTIKCGLKWMQGITSSLRPDPEAEDAHWSWTDDPKVVHSKHDPKKLYILCGFANGPAESSFVDIDSGEFYEKAEIREWILPRGDMPGHVTLGFKSITSLEPYEVVAPKPVTKEPEFAWLADLRAA